MRLGDDLKNPKWMYLKAALFLVAGTACAAGIFAQSPTARTAFLLAIGIWSFCRLYYFMFYVVEKYADPAFKFAGIGPFLMYLFRRRRGS